MVALLCRACGEPATHAHFIPWIEEPERVELACAIHEPGGYDGEWYTLHELAADAEGFLRICARSATLAPAPLVTWLRDRAGHVPPAPPNTDAPLTVKEAAKAERVSEKTISRMIKALEAEGIAWKVGSQWRIDAVALRVYLAERGSARPAKSTPARTRKPRRPPDDEVW